MDSAEKLISVAEGLLDAGELAHEAQKAWARATELVELASAAADDLDELIAQALRADEVAERAASDAQTASASVGLSVPLADLVREAESLIEHARTSLHCVRHGKADDIHRRVDVARARLGRLRRRLPQGSGG